MLCLHRPHHRQQHQLYHLVRPQPWNQRMSFRNQHQCQRNLQHRSPLRLRRYCQHSPQISLHRYLALHHRILQLHKPVLLQSQHRHRLVNRHKVRLWSPRTCSASRHLSPLWYPRSHPHLRRALVLLIKQVPQRSNQQYLLQVPRP